LGGESESWTRLLSVLLALPTIICVYCLGKRLVNSSAGVIASALYALMPLMLIYNREVRMYSLLVTLSCISLLLLFRALSDNKIIDWVLFSLVTFLTLTTHYHGFLILTAQGTFLLLYVVKVQNRQGSILRFALASGVALLLFLPFVPALREAIGTTGEMWRSGAKSILVSKAYLAFSLTLGQTIMPWHPFALLGGLAALALGTSTIWHNRSNRNLMLVLVSYGSVVFIIGPIVSHDMPRYYLFFVPLLCVLLASGITSTRPRILSVVFTSLLLFSWIAAGINYYTGKDFHIMAHVDPWREVAGFLRARVNSNDKIIIKHSNSLSSYYLPRYGFRDQILTDISELAKPDNPLPENLWLVVGNPGYTNLASSIREFLMHQYGYRPANVVRFVRDANYLNKKRFFNKEFAEYRVEVFRLHR